MKLKVSPNTFIPNLTTQLMVDNMNVQSGDSVLDLGCGVGPVAIAAAKNGAGEVVAGMVIKLFGANSSTVIARVEERLAEIVE